MLRAEADAESGCDAGCDVTRWSDGGDGVVGRNGHRFGLAQRRRCAFLLGVPQDEDGVRAGDRAVRATNRIALGSQRCTTFSTSSSLRSCSFPLLEEQGPIVDFCRKKIPLGNFQKKSSFLCRTCEDALQLYGSVDASRIEFTNRMYRYTSRMSTRLALPASRWSSAVAACRIQSQLWAMMRRAR